MIKCWLVEQKTGEILTEHNILNFEDIDRAKKFKKKKELEEQFKYTQSTFLGNFVFFIFKNMEFLQEVLSDEDLVKFIFIGTYVKGNGCLKADNNVTLINKKKMQELLNISRANFNKFYNKLIDNNLIRENKEGVININLDYFFRGYEKEYKKLTDVKLSDFLRIYIESTRELYKNTPIRKHKQLSILYKLIPYCNYKYNILCRNTNEIDAEKLDILTIADVVDILGYNKSQIARFKKDFYSVQVQEYKAFLSIQGTEKYLDSFIVVNPKLYFRGSELEDLEYLLTLFKIK
mgnify:CR=1 FL=1